MWEFHLRNFVVPWERRGTDCQKADLLPRWYSNAPHCQTQLWDCAIVSKERVSCSSSNKKERDWNREPMLKFQDLRMESTDNKSKMLSEKLTLAHPSTKNAVSWPKRPISYCFLYCNKTLIYLLVFCWLFWDWFGFLGPGQCWKADNQDLEVSKWPFLAVQKPLNTTILHHSLPINLFHPNQARSLDFRHNDVKVLVLIKRK